MFVIQSPVIASTILDSMPPLENHVVTVKVHFKNREMAKVFCNTIKSEIARYSEDD